MNLDNIGRMPLDKLAEFGKQLQARADERFGWNPKVPDKPTREDLKTMTPDQVVAAHEAGQLDHLFNTTGDTND